MEKFGTEFKILRFYLHRMQNIMALKIENLFEVTSSRRTELLTIQLECEYIMALRRSTWGMQL